VKVLVYVEGPGDKVALGSLFRTIIDQGHKSRVGISFHPMRGKSEILKELGLKAANHLKSNPEDYVFALPDLYPMAEYDRTEFPHRSFEQLKAHLQERFHKEAGRFGLAEEVRSHYRVHCLKHDLEVLLLGAPEALRQRLKTEDGIEKNWRRPVEDQNDKEPPKRVIERLFMKYRKQRYSETTDAPWILERAVSRIRELCDACPQNFRPLFTELDRLSRGEQLS
jgi:hypothetical protein